MEQKREPSPYDPLCSLPRVDFVGEGLHYLPRVQYGKDHPRQYMECIYKDGLTNRPVVGVGFPHNADEIAHVLLAPQGFRHFSLHFTCQSRLTVLRGVRLFLGL